MSVFPPSTGMVASCGGVLYTGNFNGSLRATSSIAKSYSTLKNTGEKFREKVITKFQSKLLAVSKQQSQTMWGKNLLCGAEGE